MSRISPMRLLAYTGGLIGLALVLGLAVRTDLTALAHIWLLAGWSLLWLVPYRGLYFLLYACGWRRLLMFYPRAERAGLGYLWWVSSVREAVDRLLPVASVGGAVVGVRLLGWRGLSRVQVGASVIVEAILTMSAAYLFAASGIILMLKLTVTTSAQRQVLSAIALTLPIPVACFVLLRYGRWFGRLQRILGSAVGFDTGAEHGATLDLELRTTLRRTGALLQGATFQLAAMISAAFEIWLVLRLFGHPVEALTALILESATQAVRHLAFFIPGGIGAQEAGFVIFGHLFGIDAELALAVSLAKRLREVLCGLPALAAWQWLEAKRLQQGSRRAC
jgi:putative membrane protein